MDWQAFSQQLSLQLDQAIHIETARAVSGGDIHQAYQLHTSSGNYFLKLNQARSLPLFKSEAAALNAIYKSNSIRCPQAFGTGIDQGYAWLLMEFLDLTHQGDYYQRGRNLAAMHHNLNKTSQPFGWFEDNYIGHTLQKNTWHFDWVTFYGQERLKPQIELAVLNGASQALYEQGMKLIEKLPFWFETYSVQASLLHGDLWGGNSSFAKSDMPNQGSEPVIFDPASYYGDRETDIAMTELFGGYSTKFYDGYNSVFPLDPGYQSRKPLYNLYHVLNHFNLFGGHYQDHALNMTSQLLRKAS